jgi:hypothetical protein
MTLRGLPLVLQAVLGDGLAFDPFSLQQDYLSASEVDVGRGAIIDALVVAAVGCSRPRGLGLSFHFARGSSASGATLDLALRDAVLDLVRGRGPGRIASQSLLARLRKSDFCRLDLGRARPSSGSERLSRIRFLAATPSIRWNLATHPTRNEIRMDPRHRQAIKSQFNDH